MWHSAMQFYICVHTHKHILVCFIKFMEMDLNDHFILMQNILTSMHMRDFQKVHGKYNEKIMTGFQNCFHQKKLIC